MALVPSAGGGLPHSHARRSFIWRSVHRLYDISSAESTLPDLIFRILQCLAQSKPTRLSCSKLKLTLCSLPPPKKNKNPLIWLFVPQTLDQVVTPVDQSDVLANAIALDILFVVSYQAPILVNPQKKK